MFTLLLIILITDCLVLAVAVLLQAGQGGGLAGLGGGASTDSFLGGRQATTVLTTVSWWCGGIFLGVSVILAGLSTRNTAPTSVLQGQFDTPAPIQVPSVPLDLPGNNPGGTGGIPNDTN